MRYHVINGEVCVGTITIGSVAGSSTILVGDTRRVALSSALESPPEELIVGAPPVSFVPLVGSPTAPRGGRI